MLTSAFILESTPQTFGSELLCLFAKNFGKIFCTTKKSFRVPSIPAYIEIELFQKNEGLYSAQNIQIEDTFPQLRSNEKARKSLLELHKLLKQALPLHTNLDEVWAVFASLIPCLHLFLEETTPLFLMAYTLANSQGIDFSWVQENGHLDKESQEAILSFPSKSFEEIFSMHCPEQALRFILEELNIK